MTHDDQVMLETLIDRYNLETVVSYLSTIAFEKQAHIETNWNDQWLANMWKEAGVILDSAETSIRQAWAGR